MDRPWTAATASCCPGHIWHGGGQSSFTGPALGLYRALDGVFSRLAAEAGAAEHVFPTFLPAAMLGRLDYFYGFPHLATFAAALDEDEGNLDSFRRQAGIRPDGSVGLTRLAPVREVLTPAACYHFYRLYEGSPLEAPKFLTTLATCHRRESHYVPLERQWSFGMREIVCLGSYEEVTAFLDRYRGRVAKLCAELDLSVTQAAASDPFFRPTQNLRWIAQRLDPVKTEFLFEGYLAVASVNFHRDFFGETFNIRRFGGAAFSGCIAFGLERWIYMIIQRWGSRPGDWPCLEGLP
jgi:hypothetical protein